MTKPVRWLYCALCATNSPHTSEECTRTEPPYGKNRKELSMKQGFLDPLRVENVDAIHWKLLERFRWRGSKGDLFEIPDGEITDFATVPWWSQAIVPRTGTWTKAAVLHDKMCNDLNRYRKEKLKVYNWIAARKNGFSAGPIPSVPIKPLFTSIDTDAIFRKNARDGGTDAIRSELLWFGVRCGSLVNPARREGWLRTFPRFLGDLVAILTLLVLVVAAISLAWPW